MGRPKRHFPFDSKFDFSSRPETYWPETPPKERDVSLALVGGTYTPDPAEDEVEIVRIGLASVTGFVIQILARRSSPDGEQPRIRYRVVDEFVDRGHAYVTVPQSSARPLTLGQVIDLIDLTRAVGTNINDDETYNVGLVESTREFNYREGDQDAESLVDFIHVTSAFYPELSEYFDERGEHWYQSIKLDGLDDEVEYAASPPAVSLESPRAPESYTRETLLAARGLSSSDDKSAPTISKTAVERWFRYQAGLDGFEIRAERAPSRWGPGKLLRVHVRWLDHGEEQVRELENSVAALAHLEKQRSVSGAENLKHDLGDQETSARDRTVLALSMGETEAARSLIDELSAAEPFEAAELLEFLGRADEALRLYRIAADDRPEDAAWAFYRAGLDDEAESLFRRAEEEGLLGLAAVARRRGDDDSALELYGRWRGDPDEPY